MPTFPPLRLSDLRTVDLNELALRSHLDELDELALEPGPMLDALLAGLWLGVRVAVAVLGATVAAGIAIDRRARLRRQ